MVSGVPIFKLGTPKIINFPFGTNGKLMVSGVPIFKHFRVGKHENHDIVHVLSLFNEASLCPISCDKCQLTII